MVLSSDDLRNLADALDQMTATRASTDVEIDGPGTSAEVLVRGMPVGLLAWNGAPDDQRYVLDTERPR